MATIHYIFPGTTIVVSVVFPLALCLSVSSSRPSTHGDDNPFLGGLATTPQNCGPMENFGGRRVAEWWELMTVTIAKVPSSSHSIWTRTIFNDSSSFQCLPGLFCSYLCLFILPEAINITQSSACHCSSLPICYPK